MYVEVSMVTNGWSVKTEKAIWKDFDRLQKHFILDQPQVTSLIFAVQFTICRVVCPWTCVCFVVILILVSINDHSPIEFHTTAENKNVLTFAEFV